MPEKREGSLHLLAYSLRTNYLQLITTVIITLVISVDMIDLYSRSPGSFNNYYSPPIDGLAILLFAVNFSLMPSFTLSNISTKLGLTSSNRRSLVLLSNIVPTAIFASIATGVSTIVVSIINYQLTRSSGAAASPATAPTLLQAMATMLNQTFALIWIFLYLMLVSYVLLIWGGRLFSGQSNMIISLVVTFLVGFALQLNLLAGETSPGYLPVYYLFALGSLTSGISLKQLVGSSTPDVQSLMPLPFAIIAALGILALLLFLSWRGLASQDVGGS